MPKINIVIPTYGHWNLTHSQLWQLHRKEREHIDYVKIINNGSHDEDETANGLAWWRASKLLPIYSITLDNNIGFVKASNMAMKDTIGDPEDILILLSNDVLIHGKFISQIKTIFSENSKSLVGGVLYTRDTGWNNFNDKIFPYLEGWLLATTLGNWAELNYLDERFSPNDYEDIDLSTTALSLGYELVPLNNVGLVHMGAQTIKYGDERLAQTNINKKKFEEKWIK